MRGLRRCSFRQMGMPEPRKVGRVTGELPTLFVYIATNFCLSSLFRELKDTTLISYGHHKL